jgi:hypothetical protein
MRGQEREHAPRRHQMPHQRTSIQQLPVHPFSALHVTIIPGHRTHCRRTRQPGPALFRALLGLRGRRRAVRDNPRQAWYDAATFADERLNTLRR